jgi:hypothetical protein
MKEEWIEIKHKRKKPNTIVAVSNTGCVKRYSGEITVSTLRESMIRYKGKQMRLHRLIATLFIPKTQEDIRLGRDCVDHITHNPTDMNINDVRNLRWCTTKENNNFEEAISNKRGIKRTEETKNKLRNRVITEEWRRKNSESHKGKTPWNKGLRGTAVTKHYKGKEIDNQSVQGG